MTSSRFALVAVLLLIATTAGASLKSLQFAQDDPQALVLIEEADGMFNGVVQFVEVDLNAMAIGTRKFSIAKDVLNGRLGTRNKALQTSGEYALWKFAVSRFSGAKRPTGDFALVKYTSPPGPFSQTVACLPDGAPVFRFKPGVANLISEDMLPVNGGSYAFLLAHPKYARSGSDDDLTDAQSVLDENVGVKAKVAYAELIGFVKFLDKNGKAASCGAGKSIIAAKP
jgi:hypothetical protein